MPEVIKAGKITSTGEEIGSDGWREFLRLNTSFRYESGAHGGFTATNIKGYWYGSRRINGTLYRKYIGTGEELTIAVLEAVAIALVDMAQKPKDKTPPKSLITEMGRQIEALSEEVARLRAEVEILRGESADPLIMKCSAIAPCGN